MQTLTAIRETVEETEEDFDDFYSSFADYKAAEARFAAQIKEDLVALRNGTLKTYTEEEFDELFAEFERKMEEKYGNRQNSRARKI